MTARITIEGEGPARHITVEGRLTAAEVGELEHAIGDRPGSVSVELANLRSADAAGIAALRRLRAEGIRLLAAPPHLAWRIADEEG